MQQPQGASIWGNINTCVEIALNVYYIYAEHGDCDHSQMTGGEMLWTIMKICIRMSAIRMLTPPNLNVVKKNVIKTVSIITIVLLQPSL